jgi:hypothetical protein
MSDRLASVCSFTQSPFSSSVSDSETPFASSKDCSFNDEASALSDSPLTDEALRAAASAIGTEIAGLNSGIRLLPLGGLMLRFFFGLGSSVAVGVVFSSTIGSSSILLLFGASSISAFFDDVCGSGFFSSSG